ncbi:GGDEF domain-containing protein [Actinophytocola sp.]|uniref:GGDEF domain-containing protein n=1 Tax=Actinophytocola sp. TaxID=1872138 RepID=UPI002ED9480E
MGDVAAHRRRGLIAIVRGWKVWGLPPRALGYVLTIDAVALVIAVWTAVREPGTRDQWLVTAVLAASAGVHLHLSNAVERIRRDHSHTPHVDLCGIWTFAGALLLPPLPVTLLVIGIYVHRWWLVGRWDAGRPPHRTVFTIAMMTLAALAVVWLVNATGLSDRLAGQEPLSWVDGLLVVAAIGVEWTVNTLLVGVVILLTARLKRVWEAIGSGADNLLEAGQLVLGVFVALAAVRQPWLAVLMIVPVVALHRTVLLHQLQLAARTDDKTGLLNATAWHQQAKAELLRARQEPDGSVGLFMLDLDLFSEVNNRYGHLAGDAVLRRVAHLLTTSIRRGDAVGRFGGEEFAVLLPGVDQAEALAVAERIRRRMHQVQVTDGDGGLIEGLTVSIGIAIYPEVAEDTVDGLLSAADSALYAAKHNGRDQVRFADEERALPWLPTTRRPLKLDETPDSVDQG